MLPTADYLYGLRAGEEHEVELEEGKRLILGLQAVSEPDERGFRTVMCTINGQLRPINIRDRSVSSDAPVPEKADTSKPGHVVARRSTAWSRSWSPRATRSRPATPSPPSRR